MIDKLIFKIADYFGERDVYKAYTGHGNYDEVCGWRIGGEFFDRDWPLAHFELRQPFRLLNSIVELVRLVKIVIKARTL